MTKLSTITKGAKSWADVHAALVPLNDAAAAQAAGIKQAGFLFEDFAYGYFKAAPEYSAQLKNVWREKDLPVAIRKRLTLAKRDHGVDLVLEDLEGRLLAVQVKFKTKQTGKLGWTKDRLSSWLAESDEADGLVLFTNASGVDGATIAKADKKGFRLVSLQDLTELDERTIENILLAEASKSTKERVLWSPLPHQADALKAVVKGLKKADKGQLILPCGAGKTFTGVRIAEKLKSKRTLIIVPTLDLVRQTMKVWAAQMETQLPYVSVCSENDIDTNNDDGVRARTFDVPGLVTTDPGMLAAFRERFGSYVVFSTYQSLHAVIEAGMEFDLTICDEAHKVATSKLSDFTLVHRDELRTKLRLFMTATPRVLSNQAAGQIKRRQGVEATEVVACMSDERTFGKPLFEMNFADAIEQGILCDYKVIIPVIDDPQVWEHIESRDYVEDTDAYQAAVSAVLARTMEEHGLTHALTFHSNVKRAAAFQAVHKKRSKGFKTFHVNGTQSSNRRVNTLDKFKAAKKAIITNARCLTEGVDVPAIDTVAFVDPRHSKVDIVQAVGRAMRIKDGKAYGAIILPVFVKPGQDADTAIEQSAFDNVHGVLQALMDQDHRLLAEIMSIKTGEGTKETTKPRVVFDHGTEHLVLKGFEERLLSALTTRVLSSHSWELHLEELRVYVAEHGTPPAAASAKWTPLSGWVKHQRSAYKKGRLSTKQCDLLAAAGLLLDPYAARWEEVLSTLTKHKESTGGFATTQESIALRGVINNIRVTHKKGKLLPGRVAQLKALEFPFRAKSRLTAEAALSIYNDTRPQTKIMEAFGIGRKTVFDIKSGKSWASVTGHKASK